MQIDLLFVCLMEEAAEVQQAVSKLIRFGSNNHNPKTPERTNVDDIMTEYYQLQAVMELLQEKGKLPILSPEEIRYIKKDKKRKLKYFEDRRKEHWQEKHTKPNFR